MSVENDATSGKIHGGVERESNDTVIFISEQGRRIRFRYSGKSLQYPSAAGYQCTQCPVTALMINAQFRVVDPCAGHDCSVDECHLQSTSPAEDDIPVLSPQQSPAKTSPASGSLRLMKKAKKVIAKATYDANGSIQWPSERYTGVTFTFRTNKTVPGRQRYFQCSGCSSKCEKYRDCLKACGIIRRCLIVWDGNIVDFHPDDAGTTQGHLCQQPLLEEKLKKSKALVKKAASKRDLAKVADGGEVRKGGKKKLMKAKALEKATAQDAYNAEIANCENEDANPASKGKVFHEVSAKSRNARGRSLAKRPSALSIEPTEDNTFGKISALSPSALTKAEHLVWSSAPNIRKGPLRNKELIVYRSKKHRRRFKFILAGSSSLDEDAFDYFCLDCWNSYGEDCRVTVRSSTQEFIITDPDQTSSGRHACMQASSARPNDSFGDAKKRLSSRPRRSHAVAKAPISGLANVETESRRIGRFTIFPVVELTARSMEHFSVRYQAKLKFVMISQGKKGQAYYVCGKCRTLQGKLKGMGYQRFGYSKIELYSAVVVGGRFVLRPPDECGVQLFTGDTVERRHICHDDKLKRLLDGDRATCEERRDPSPKRMRDATHGSPSGCAARTIIHTQSTDGSRTDNREHDGSNQITIDRAELSNPRDSAAVPGACTATSEATSTPGSEDQHVGAQAELPCPSDSTIDQAIIEQATFTWNNENNRQSADLDLGPAVDALDKPLQRAESTCSVSSAGQYAIGPRKSASSVSAIQFDAEVGRKPHRLTQRREAANAHDSTDPTPTTLKTNGVRSVTGRTATSGTRKRCGGLLVDVKPRHEDRGLGSAVGELEALIKLTESTYSDSSVARYATSSRADTSHESEASVLSLTQSVLEEEQKPRRFDERREIAVVEDSYNPTPVARMSNSTSRSTGCTSTSYWMTFWRKRVGGLSADVKPPTKKSPEVLTIEDLDDDTDDDGASRTSKKRVKREGDDDSAAKQLQEDPAARFNRFLQEFEFWDEYSDYSFNNRGKPRDFVQLPHVREQWIQFTNRD